jgi:hypothetical protein
VTRPDPAMLQRPPRPRRRGCFGGCLGCIPQLLMLAVFCVLVVEVVMLVIGPWVFHVGGHWRVWPAWQGVGQLHEPAGDYPMYVLIAPSPHGTRLGGGGQGLTGQAYICGPNGRAWRLRLTGGAPRSAWWEMKGKPVWINVAARPLNWNFVDYHKWLPQFALWGQWDGPNLVMQDKGTFANAFLPDGQVNPHAGATWAQPGQPVATITFTESSKSAFDVACRAMRR